MDARSLRLPLAILFCLIAAPFASAAQWKTPNFVVHAPTEDFAKKVAFTAEQWRSRLAKEWLGYELPNWYQPCPIRVKVGTALGAGGATTFNFDRNPKTGESEVFGWRMNVQGTAERILDSVIPHEVSHTIFASHFRRPLPRWADEGAATLAEHESEQRRQDLHLKQVWNSHKIPLASLLSMTEYPSDMRDVMTLYAQGYSLADFLVQKRGKATYLRFLDAAEKDGWEAALKKHYDIDGIESLDGKWGNWVLAGSPDLPKDTMLADAGHDRRSKDTDRVADASDAGTAMAAASEDVGSSDGAIFRAQNEDGIAAAWEAAASRPTAPPRPDTSFATESESAGDFGMFLAPQSRAGRTVAEFSQSPSDSGKEPRPAPLGGHLDEMLVPAGDVGATETSSRAAENGDRSLPRTSRVEPSAARRNFDFFQSASDGRTERGSVLGKGTFPGVR